MANIQVKAPKRTDNKGRILREGEIQRTDGRYMYAVVDPVTKQRKYIYSWKLERHDPMPAGKKSDKSLREKVKEFQVKNFIGVSTDGAGLTVSQLVDKYTDTKRNVRASTKAGYKTVKTFLEKDALGKKRIDTVSVIDAKLWISNLQKNGKSYSSIHTIRGVLRPAFQLAVESNYIFINPFNFELKDVLINDSIKREAVDIKTENKFLKFLKEDEYYNSIYDGALILFKTGLRISELCGLTLSDIDLDKRTIDINHQLQYNTGIGKNIRATKTNAGSRVLPMSNEVYEAFVRVVNSRKEPDIEEIIEDSDGKKYTGFLFLDNKGKSTVAYYWEKRFQHAIEKHNTIFKDELPVIVPHMCRHTYCTRMAVSGVSPNTLKYLMGHSDIQTTLNVYTHTKYDDAKKELEQIEAMRELENLNGTNSDKVVKFPNPA